MSRRPRSWVRWRRVPPWSWWDPPAPPAGPLAWYVPATISDAAKRALDLAHTLGLAVYRFGPPAHPIWLVRGKGGELETERPELLTFDTLRNLT